MCCTTECHLSDIYGGRFLHQQGPARLQEKHDRTWENALKDDRLSKRFDAPKSPLVEPVLWVPWCSWGASASVLCRAVKTLHRMRGTLRLFDRFTLEALSSAKSSGHTSLAAIAGYVVLHSSHSLLSICHGYSHIHDVLTQPLVTRTSILGGGLLQVASAILNRRVQPTPPPGNVLYPKWQAPQNLNIPRIKR